MKVKEEVIGQAVGLLLKKQIRDSKFVLDMLIIKVRHREKEFDSMLRNRPKFISIDHFLRYNKEAKKRQKEIRDLYLEIEKEMNDIHILENSY